MVLQPMAVTVDESSARRPQRKAGKRPLPSEWESNVYQLDQDRAAELGFSLGSVKLTSNSRLLIMDTTRSETVRVGRKTQRWGCGYRLQVSVSDIDATAKLTLPAIAASAEIGHTEASVSLTVRGYPDNDLWDVIPPPAPLNVESYKVYLGAAENIQKRFLALGDRAVSVLLASDDPQSDLAVGGITDDDLRASAAAIWAARSLQEGRILAQALEDFGHKDDDELKEIIEGTYHLVRGGAYDSTEGVTAEEMARARQYLLITGID